MAKKKVKLTLSPKHIEDFINGELIRGLQLRAKEIADEIMVHLAEDAVPIVQRNIRMFVNKEFSTGEMERSVMSYVDLNKGIAIIRVNAEYGAYVEFGTGVVGKKSPMAEANRYGWRYDVNNHGDSGWTYRKGDEFFWTKGQHGTGFMHLSSVDIRRHFLTIIKQMQKEAKK